MIHERLTTSEIEAGRNIVSRDLVSRGVVKAICFYDSDKKAFRFRFKPVSILSEAHYIPEEDVLAAVKGDSKMLQLWMIHFLMDLRRN